LRHPSANRPKSHTIGGIWASVEARPEIERLGLGSLTSSGNSSRGHSAGWGDGGGGGTGTRAGGDPIVAILVPSTSRSFRCAGSQTLNPKPWTP
jgi:hypothetical protein